MGYAHLPVMMGEAIEYLDCRAGGIYLDGTLGGGGHGEAILKASAPDGVLIGIDRDKAAIRQAERVLKIYENRVVLIRGDFGDIKEVIAQAGYTKVDGILLDLGVSSYQLDEAERGFSFRSDAPLDMRMDRRSSITAYDIVNNLAEEELAGIIKSYGEERFSMRIAKAIIRAREIKPIKTTGELAGLISGAIPRRFHGTRIDPATRTFQAIRIAVNSELDALRKGLAEGMDALGSGGRMVVISYHSLEDRIVKKAFREGASPCVCPRDFPRCVCGKSPKVKLFTGRVIKAGASEVEGNPRARSAKLRAIQKI